MVLFSLQPRLPSDTLFTPALVLREPSLGRVLTSELELILDLIKFVFNLGFVQTQFALLADLRILRRSYAATRCVEVQCV